MEQLPHNNTETANVPHAGNLPEGMRELPVQDFDKTTLHEAAHGNNPDGTPIIKTPDNAADLIPKKSRRNQYIALGSIAGVLIAGVSYLGISSSQNNEPKGSGPVAEAPLDPAEVPVGEEPAEEVPFGEMPANPVPVETPPVDTETEPTNGAELKVVGLPTVAEIEIARDIIQLQSDWMMSGANQDMYDYYYESDYSFAPLSEYINKITAATDSVYIEALYGDNATNEAFKERIDTQKQIHAEVLAANFQTYGVQNEAPFSQTEEFMELQDVSKRDDGTTKMFVRSVRENNMDQNIVDGFGDGSVTRWTFVVGEVDGSIKLIEAPDVVVQSL
jgi:hypothetical protein